MKAKFDSAKLNQFFIDRGEQVGLAVAVVLAGLLGYGAYSLAAYEKTPEDLAKDVAAAEGVFRRSELNKPAAGLIQPKQGFKPQIEAALTPVSPAQYGGIEWNAPLFDTKSRRTEPVYLAARDLRATFKYAAINVKVGGGGAQAPQNRTVGDEWLSVTGLIPLADQEAEYFKAFGTATDAKTNAAPRYGLYKLQRAEVTSDDPNVPVAWDLIEPTDLKVAISDERAKWQGDGPAYVEAKFARIPVTQPLPPLADKSEYGDWAAHPPEIVAATTAEKPAAAQPAAAAPAAAAANDPFAGGGSAASAAAPEVAPEPEKPGETKPQYLLFRFLDFNIEPTKRYRYRVKLVLNNPNYKLAAAHLEKPELAEGETREADWSEPSPPAYVPVLERYFAGDNKTIGSDNQEPVVVVGVKQWMPNLAADTYFDFEPKLRGAVLNEGAANVVHEIPGTGKSGKASAPLRTNSLLADFAWEKTENRQKGPGSGLEAKPINKPSEVLLRTPRGELVITTQLASWPLRDEMKNIGTAPAAEAAPGAEAAPAEPAGGDVRRTLRLQ